VYDQNSDIPSAAGLRVGIAVSRYHGTITTALHQGATDAFTEAGGRGEDILLASTPGAFELPVVCKALADREDLDAVVALACVVRGETPHDQYICEAVSRELARISVDSGKPVAFGVLTCLDLDQARERAGGSRGNKGAEAMAAAIGTVHALRAIAGSTEPSAHVHRP
jgi:6,7-dimethyl-8-ribityllumazine synthase